jgi:wobble nucleotide-excising tRNase
VLLTVRVGHDGSHFSHDDAFYTLDQASINVYLDIFKQIFVKANQEAHYEMMMAIQSDLK